MSMFYSKKIIYIILISLTAMENAFSYTASESETVDLVYGDEQMISIATGNNQLLYKAPAVASVITQQQILNSSATTLNELLESVPGLHISSNYFAGDAIYSMRGFFRDPDAGVLLLFNGTPLNNLQKGSRPSAFQMPLASIDHIEIIRGPGSAVYGADAFVGTINIITKDFDDTNDLSAGVRFGSFSHQSYWFQNSFKYTDWSLSYNLELQSDKGDDSRIVNRDLQSYLDDQTSTDVSLAPSTMETEYNVINLLFNASNNNWMFKQLIWGNKDQSNEHGIPGIDTLDHDGNTDSQLFLSSLQYRDDTFTKHWSLDAKFSYLHSQSEHHLNLLPAGSNAPIGTDGNLFTPGTRSVIFPSGMTDLSETIEDHLNLEVIGFYRGFDQQQIRLSAGYQYQKYESSEWRNFGPGVLDEGQSLAEEQLTDVSSDSLVFLPANSRKIAHISIQDEWDFSTDWTLTAGLRYDQYSDFGNTSNPRIALVWQTRYDLTTKLLYGRAFRAPTYTELYLQNRPGTDGNPDLKPEVIDTIELAFDYRPNSDFTSTLSFFDYHAKDLIFSVDSTTAANTTTMENTGVQDAYGIEFDFHWKLNNQLKLYSNYSWQHSSLFDTDLEPAFAPHQQSFIELNYAFAPYWHFIPQLHWVDFGPREQGDYRDEISNSTRLDARLRYRNHYKNWEFSLIARNILNDDLVEPSLGNETITGGAAIEEDIPMSGTALYVEYRIYP